MWWYKDLEGEVQGPFPGAQMTSWYAAGYFTPEDQVSYHGPQGPFVSISELKSGFVAPMSSPAPQVQSSSDEWMYMSRSGLEVGPFSSLQMRLWRSNGLLSDLVMARPIESRQLKPLKDWQALSAAVPFQWVYRDEDGKEFGPVSLEELEEIIEANIFQKEDLVGVKRSDWEDFEGLSEIKAKLDKFYFLNKTDSSKLSSSDPYSIQQVQLWITKGSVSPNTLFRRELDEFFKPLKSFPKFASLFEELEESQFVEEESKQENVVFSEGPWVYIDNDGVTQGPFSTEQMMTWIEAGYLDQELQVRPQNEKEFQPLKLARKRMMMPKKDTTAVITWKFKDFEGSVHGPYSELQMKELGKLGVLSQDFMYQANNATWIPFPPGQPWSKMVCEEWEYLDSNQEKQGPFTTYQMRQWHHAGFIQPDLLVKTTAESDFTKLGARAKPAFLSLRSAMEHVPAETSLPHSGTEFPQTRPGVSNLEDYYGYASFNQRTGKFEASGPGGTRWQRLGLPDDFEGRQVYQYFDSESWHSQRNEDLRKERAKAQRLMDSKRRFR